MATDRITEITVKFEDETGQEVRWRTYKIIAGTDIIKGYNPQGRVPGRIEVSGYVSQITDMSVDRAKGEPQ